MSGNSPAEAGTTNEKDALSQRHSTLSRQRTPFGRFEMPAILDNSGDGKTV
jgi:hypothetical protein